MAGNRFGGSGGTSVPQEAVQQLQWKSAVLDSNLKNPPSKPKDGDRYLVPVSATGEWKGEDTLIATWDSRHWSFEIPNLGDTVYCQDSERYYIWNEKKWRNVGETIDHSTLLNRHNLKAHPQYQLKSEKGQAAGFAGLDAEGKISESVLPKVVVTRIDPRLTDNRPPTPHGLEHHKETKLEQLNEVISDATLDDAKSPRTPKAHSLAGPEHSPVGLRSLNAKLTDGNLDLAGTPRPALPHKLTDHESVAIHELNKIIEGPKLDSRGESRPPKGNAGGSLGGEYPNPHVKEQLLDIGKMSGTLRTNGAHGRRGGGNLHPEATDTSAGFLSPEDKRKLDNIEPGATQNPTEYPQYQHRNEVNKTYPGLKEGKLDGKQLPYGTVENTACEGNDARLSDARKPLPHSLGDHESITLIELNALVRDANFDDNSKRRPPTPHGLAEHKRTTLKELNDILDVDLDAVNDPRPPKQHTIMSHARGDIDELNEILGREKVDAAGTPRPPKGAAKGQLDGVYPNPNVVGIKTTEGTKLQIGKVSDGTLLKRVGNQLVGAVLPSPHVQFAEDLTTPGGDWAVPKVAELEPDPEHGSLLVRKFDDTDEEGVCFKLNVPGGSKKLNLRIKSRAVSAPTQDVKIAALLYYREVPDNAPVSSWKSRELESVELPAGNSHYQYDSETLTLAELQVKPGSLYQFELSRNTASSHNTLLGDWALLELSVEFS